VYAARLEDGAWKIRRISNWNYRWDFQGGGTIVFEIHVGAARPGAKGESDLRIPGEASEQRQWPAASMLRVYEVR
jgi:hypothetical protein